MSNASAKTFDTVHMVRAVRDEVSSTIATMSVEEENRWLRSRSFPTRRSGVSWSWLPNKALQPTPLRGAAERMR